MLRLPNPKSTHGLIAGNNPDGREVATPAIAALTKNSSLRSLRRARAKNVSEAKTCTISVKYEIRKIDVRTALERTQCTHSTQSKPTARSQVTKVESKRGRDIDEVRYV